MATAGGNMAAAGTNPLDFGVKRRRVKILDYFGLIESNADKCMAQTDEARRDSIRATCNVCHKKISGTYRVKSNFITHLRKSHPEVYVDYQLKTGRFNLEDSANLSIASLDEPNQSMLGMYQQTVGVPQAGDHFGQMIPRHLPTSTVKDHSSTDGSQSCQEVKVEPGDDMVSRRLPLSPQQAAKEALLDFIIGTCYKEAKSVVLFL